MPARNRAAFARDGERGRSGGHFKMHGYVTEIQGDKWWAILKDPDDGPDLIAEMKDPLPDDRRGEGYLFTVHRTKAGRTYLFWPPALKITSGQRKRIKRNVADFTRTMTEIMGRDI